MENFGSMLKSIIGNLKSIIGSCLPLAHMVIFALSAAKTLLLSTSIIMLYFAHTTLELTNIMAHELVPIVLSCAVWGLELAERAFCVQCDNSSVVAAIKRGAATDSTVMQLLRCLWFFVAHYDIYLIQNIYQ